MNAATERLMTLAGAEARQIDRSPRTWPAYVERTYHAGRRSAFLEAAAIVERSTAAVEGEREAARR